MEKYCILIAVSLFFNTVYGAAVWETGAYTPSEWKPSSDNLLTKENVEDTEYSLTPYSENGKNLSGAEVLTDGSVPNADDGKNVDYTKVVGITSGSVVWKLNKASDIYDIKIFSRWGSGGRDGIAVDSVEVSTDGTEWKTFDSVAYGTKKVDRNDNSAGALFARLHDDEGFALATKISYVKINFSNEQDNNGTGYVEIEVCGTAAGLPGAAVYVDGTTEYTADLSVVVKSTGDSETVDLYFAYGGDESNLSPQRIATGLPKGAKHTINLANLNHNTTYHYTAYIVTVSGARYDMSGSFTTVFDPCRYLPKEYVQVEFIKTSGTQCVNTGVKSSPLLSAWLDFIPYKTTGEGYLGFGQQWRFFQSPTSTHKAAFDLGGDKNRLGINDSIQLSMGARYLVSCGNFYLDIQEVSGSASRYWKGQKPTIESVSQGDVYLAASGSENGYNDPVEIAVYSLLVKEGDSVVRDYVPCSNTVEKAYGLYDVQNKQFNPFIGEELDSLTAGLVVPFVKRISEPGFTIIVR